MNGVGSKLRGGLISCAWLAMGLATTLSARAGVDQPAPAGAMSRAERTRWDFFSTLTGERFARFEVAAAEPARVRHGPFALPVPGVVARHPRLILARVRCTAEDWSGLLTVLAAWSVQTKAEALRVELPPESGLGVGVETLETRVGERAITFVMRTGDGSRNFVRLSHDGHESWRADVFKLSKKPVSDN